MDISRKDDRKPLTCKEDLVFQEVCLIVNRLMTKIRLTGWEAKNTKMPPLWFEHRAFSCRNTLNENAYLISL